MITTFWFHKCSNNRKCKKYKVLVRRCGHTEDDSSESKLALIEEKIRALIQYPQTMMKPIVHRFISFEIHLGARDYKRTNY